MIQSHSGASSSPQRQYVAGTKFVQVNQHPDGKMFMIGPLSAGTQLSGAEIETVVSTFQGAIAGAGINGARLESTGHNFTVLLPNGGGKTTPRFFLNALASINSSVAIRLNTYQVLDEHWSEYSLSGRATSVGSKGIGDSTVLKLKSDNFRILTITILKALDRFRAINEVLIGFENQQTQGYRAMTIQVMMKANGVLPSGYLSGLLASQTSSQVSSFDVTLH